MLSFGRMKLPHKTYWMRTSMSQTNSGTFTPSRQRGQHLKFEDRCSLKIFKKHRLFDEKYMVCTKTLYNELQDGNLPLMLFDVPEALGRSKKKRMKVRQHKRISGKSIDERPATIAERTECGHWEIDTVVGLCMYAHDSACLSICQAMFPFLFYRSQRTPSVPLVSYPSVLHKFYIIS